MYIIAGLGNPGRQYAGTRHNMGFNVVTRIADDYKMQITIKEHKALCAKGFIGGQKVLLALPQTYMNLSGESVSAAAAWYKIPNDKIIILYDDISLPVGKLRIRTKGSAGGHNGIKSIIAHLNSDVFGRMKIGVGAPDEHVDLANHVLGHISKEEQTVLFDVLGKTCDAVAEYIANGAQSAMNKYNG